MANKPYDRYGSQIETDAQRIQREKLKYGTEVTRSLEGPSNDDYEDIACFLGPNFCAECE